MRCDSYACLDALAKKEKSGLFSQRQCERSGNSPSAYIMQGTIPEKALINQKSGVIISVSLPENGEHNCSDAMKVFLIPAIRYTVSHVRPFRYVNRGCEKVIFH